MFGLHGQHKKLFFVRSIFYNQSAIGVSTSEAFFSCVILCDSLWKGFWLLFLKCVYCLCQHDWKSLSTQIGFSLVFEEVICYDLFQSQNQYLLQQNLCFLFHLCSQRLGVVRVVFSNVLCCLDFGVWIIELKFSPFSLLFSSPFLTFTLFFSFFSFLLSLEPLVLLMLCYLAMPYAASNYHLVTSSYRLNLLPHHAT
jgi:hypothetical protein